MNAKTKTCLDLLGRSVIILIDIHYMLGGGIFEHFFPIQKLPELSCSSNSWFHYFMAI